MMLQVLSRVYQGPCTVTRLPPAGVSFFSGTKTAMGRTAYGPYVHTSSWQRPPAHARMPLAKGRPCNAHSSNTSGLNNTNQRPNFLAVVLIRLATAPVTITLHYMSGARQANGLPYNWLHPILPGSEGDMTRMMLLTRLLYFAHANDAHMCGHKQSFIPVTPCTSCIRN